MKSRLSTRLRRHRSVLRVAKTLAYPVVTARRIYSSRLYRISYINRFIRMGATARARGPIRVRRIKLKRSLDTVRVIGPAAIKMELRTWHTRMANWFNILLVKEEIKSFATIVWNADGTRLWLFIPLTRVYIGKKDILTSENIILLFFFVIFNNWRRQWEWNKEWVFFKNWKVYAINRMLPSMVCSDNELINCDLYFFSSAHSHKLVQYRDIRIEMRYYNKIIAFYAMIHANFI